MHTKYKKRKNIHYNVYCTILLFPAAGINTCSAHCYVINKQKYLNSFSSLFPQMEALSLLKKYQDVSTKSNKRHVADPADFGICSKWFNFAIVYWFVELITLYIYVSVYYLLIKFVFHFCSIIGNCCTYKPDPKESNDSTSLLSHLPP